MTKKSTSKTLAKNANIPSKKSKLSRSPSLVKVLGEGIDEFGNRFIKFMVRGSTRDVPPFSATQLTMDPAPLFAELANAGWNAFTSKARKDLLEKLQNRKSQPPTFKVVTRLGWKSGSFVLPNEVIGHFSKELECSFRHLDHQMLAKYRCKRTLKEWQNSIGSLCKGNSRLMFAASLACVGADPSIRYWTTVGWVPNLRAR